MSVEEEMEQNSISEGFEQTGGQVDRGALSRSTHNTQSVESAYLSSTIVKTPDEAVAIIGLGCIFPGAATAEEYWENILQGVNTIREVPRERWDPNLYFHPDRDTPDKTYSKIGAFIEGFEKNPLKFRIPPVSEPYIDRIQFLTLESVHQALQDAGYLEKDFPRKRTGVFLGCADGGELSDLYKLRVHWGRFERALQDVAEFERLSGHLKETILRRAEALFKGNIPKFSEDSCAGTFTSLVAGRVCHCFDLGGPGLTVDGACASSLAALDMAVTALNERRLDMAFAGGADVFVDPSTYIFFSSLGALSSRGSFPFDERADGFVLGEGAGVVLLKRVGDAIRDGDNIYAVIRGIGASSDGRAKGITAPDAKGQMRALQDAYRDIPFSPNTVSLIEAHGTGTRVGDVTEISSLTEFIRQYSSQKRFIGLGSVKSMIGHLKAGAGIAGLIKVALALHTRVLPPTINCESPRREVNWEQSPFYLLTEPHPWEEGPEPRRAGINAFGFGGLNFHAVLEEAPRVNARGIPVSIASEEIRELPADILIFRARTREELLKRLARTKAELAGAKRSAAGELTARWQREQIHNGPVVAIVVEKAEECLFLLDRARGILSNKACTEFSSPQGIYFSETPLGAEEKVAFLFPGQGSLYLNMAGDLPFYFPFVRNIFQEVDVISHRYIDTSILPFLVNEAELSEDDKERWTERLAHPEYNHPALLALALGIHMILHRVGVRPDMVAGHSLGEYLALQAAGVFDMTTAIEVTTGRGHGMSTFCQPNGAMAAVDASAEQVEPLLKQVNGFAGVANRNCPAQVVISGEAEVIERVLAEMEKKGIWYRRLPVVNAFHTRLISPCAEPFRTFLEHFPVHSPNIPVQCNLTGRAYETDGDFSSHLRSTLVQHMVSPVHFIDNVNSLYEDGARLFIEIGPGNTLTSFVNSILADKPHWTIPTNLPHRSATLQLLHAVAFCAAHGIPVDLKAMGGSGPCDTRRPVRTDRRKQGPHSPPGTAPDAVENRERNDAQENDDVTRRVVELVSRKTGYPPEFIDLDLDMEAGLGIDSIKHVEIIRELARELAIDWATDTRSRGNRISTLRQLIGEARRLSPDVSSAGSRESFGERSDDRRPVQTWDAECHRWVGHTKEAPLQGEKKPESIQGKHIVLLAGEEGPGWKLKHRLEQLGATVSSISPYAPPEAVPREFDTVIDLWAYAEHDAPSLEDCATWWQGARRRITVTLTVVRNLVRSLHTYPSRRFLWVEVTSLGGALGAGVIDRIPSRAGIGLGVSRCLIREFPDRLEGFYVDFDPREPFERVVKSVTAELIHQRRHPEIGYADGRRFEIHWKIEDVGDEEPTFRLDSDSIVLAIGGARGITAAICREIAEKTKAQFVVVGRSPIDLKNEVDSQEPISFDASREILLEKFRASGRRVVPAELDRLAWQRVWETERSFNMGLLRSKSPRVSYRHCDITDPEDVRELICQVWQEHRRIDLIIQGSGDPINKSTEDLHPGEFMDGMKSKALGTACLIGALSEVEVGAFINLSSVVGRWGNRGQSAYAVGHEMASILVAGARGKRPGRWINIFFGPWSDTGMTRIGPVMERLRGQGRTFITEEAGSRFLLREFEYGLSHSVAFWGTEISGQYSLSEGSLIEPIWDFPGEHMEQTEIRHLLEYGQKLALTHLPIALLKDRLQTNEGELLQAQLSPEECQQYRRLKHPKQRLEWLAGRIVAKRAVRMYLDAEAPEPSAIRIERSPEGEPHVAVDGLEDMPHISISHSGTMAVAAAAQSPGVGIDVEEIHDSILDIAREFSTEEEVKRVNHDSGGDRTVALTTLWTVKEASLKAIGPNTHSMSDLTIEQVEQDGRYTVCRLVCRGRDGIRSVTFCDHNYAFAVSLRLESEGKKETASNDSSGQEESAVMNPASRETPDDKPESALKAQSEDTPSTTLIVRQVSRVLKMDDVDPQASLLDLGATSVDMIRIANLLGIQPATLFEAPTIEKIALLCGRHTDPDCGSAIVPIRARGSERPLFLVHQLNGDILCYAALIRHLHPEQSVYGFRAPGLEGNKPLYAPIEEMATRYIEALRTIQPQGPYLLGGMCFGGAVAFEMAQQLGAQGDEVDVLALIDTPCPPFSFRYTLCFHYNRYAWHVKRMLRSLWNSLEDRPGPAGRRGPADRLNHLSHMLHTLRTDRLHRKAIGVYRPRRYPGRISLFLAGRPFVHLSPDPRMDWGKYTDQGLDVHVIPGSHQALLTEPAVGILAGKLGRYLDQAQAAAGFSH